LKKVLRGNKDPYSIKRYAEEVKADMALPKEVNMVAKQSFKKPTRESIARLQLELVAEFLMGEEAMLDESETERAPDTNLGKTKASRVAGTDHAEDENTTCRLFTKPYYFKSDSTTSHPKLTTSTLYQIPISSNPGHHLHLQMNMIYHYPPEIPSSLPPNIRSPQITQIRKKIKRNWL
jgi:hypothetical protein